MTTITKERLLTIKQWRETYGPGSNVVLPAEEAEELARIVLASLEAEPVLYQSCTRPTWNSGVPWTEWKERSRECYEDDLRFTDTPDHAGWIYKCRKLYTTPPAPIALEAIENAIEYIRSIAFHIDEDDYHGKHIAYFMRQALAWLEGHSCSDDRLGKADNQPVRGNQAAESNRGNEWTGNPDIDNAIIMLDRIDTAESCDDDRIEAVKAVLRRLAGNSPVTPDMTTGWQELTEQEYEFVKDNASENAEFRTVYTAPPATVVPDERAAFNAWNNDENLPIAGVGAKNAAWLAWQARAELGRSLAVNSPVTPDGWISCSERMPPQDDWILIYSKHGEYMAGQVQGEYVELSDGTLSWLGNALYWMPLPEPPQEVNRG
ncbi:Valyl-tRNA synthetase [Escherichia coli]|nr:Valyl-tRNA synthetase [Escherichia coli]